MRADERAILQAQIDALKELLRASSAEPQDTVERAQLEAMLSAEHQASLKLISGNELTLGYKQAPVLAAVGNLPRHREVHRATS